MEVQWAEHLVNSLLYKWYTASKTRAEFIAKRWQATSRRRTAAARKNYKRAERIDCPGVGCLASDFMETITDELSWWPTEPLDRWTTTMLEQVVGVGAALNQPAVLQVCINKGALDIRRWAEQKLRAMQEKVRECMRVDGSCLVLLGDQEREMEGEQLPADLFGCGEYGL